jgi:hypothetical protein
MKKISGPKKDDVSTKTCKLGPNKLLLGWRDLGGFCG